MGRIAKPWYRKQDNQWYTSLGSVQTPLRVFGKDNESAAWLAFHTLKTAPKTAPSPVTIGEVIDAYLEDVRDRVELSTYRTYRSLVAPFRDRWTDTPASEMTAKVVEDYSRNPTVRRVKKWSASARTHFITVVSGAFKLAVRERRLSVSPLDSIRLPPQVSRGADSVLTDEEFGRLLEVVPKCFGDLLRFCRWTGCRPGEARVIEAKDVVWEGRVVIVRKHKTAKRGKTRQLPLCTEAVLLLWKLAASHPTGTLFRNTSGRPWTPIAMMKLMYENRDRAGLPRVTMYFMRHTFATTALVHGVPDAKVAAILGHTGTKMLHSHYGHVAEQTRDLADVVTQLWKRKNPDQVAGGRCPSGFVELPPNDSGT